MLKEFSFSRTVTASLIGLAFGLPNAAHAQQAPDAQSAPTPEGAADRPAGSPKKPQEVTAVQEVVVTAQKRQERTIDVPISMTVFDAKQLQDRNIVDVSKLASYTPGLEVEPSPGGGAGIVLRGVTTGVGGVGVDPSVGVYEDGVYVARDWVALQSYLDVDQASVLRGPQGTLYGRNTTGGAYNIQHALPTKAFEAGASMDYSNYDSGGFKARETGFVSGAILGDTVLGRLALGHDTVADFTKNLYTGKRAPEHQGEGIGTLQIKPSSTFDITLRGDFMEQKGRVGSNFHVVTTGTLNSAAAVPADPYQYRADFPGNDDSLRNGGFSANVAWHLPDGYEAKSITGMRNMHIVTDYDSDGTELPIYTAVTNDRSNSFSQEFQLISPKNQKVDWVAGAYFYHERAHDLTTSGGPTQYGPFYLQTSDGSYMYSGSTALSTTIPFDYRGVFDSTNNTSSAALFGQLGFHLTDQVEVDWGIRYTNERRTFKGTAGTTWTSEGTTGVYGFNPATACQTLLAANPVTTPAGLSAADAQAACQADLAADIATYNNAATSVVKRSTQKLRFGNTSQRLALQYHADKDTDAYVSVTQGFKSGGFNSYDTDAAYSGSQPGQPGVPTIAFQPPFGPEKLTSYEAGVKGYAWNKRLQYSLDYWYYDWSNIQAQLYNYTTRTSNVTSDAKATAQGPEVDLFVRPWEGGQVDLNAAYIDSKYTHFGSTFSDVVTGQDADFTGTALPGTPKWKWNLGLQHTLDALGGYLTLRAEFQHRSAAYWVYTKDPDALSGGYNLVNTRMTYATDNGKFEGTLFVENLGNKKYDYYRFGTSTTGIEGVIAPPRTIGIQLRAYL